MKFDFLSALICLIATTPLLGQVTDIENDSLRNLNVCTTYGKEGTISRIVIRPNRDETRPNGIDFIQRPYVEQVLEEFVPDSVRGRRTGGQKSNFGRAMGETIYYSRWVLTITTACSEDACGVSFAELRKRKAIE